MNFKRLIFLLILCLNFNLSGNAQEWKKFMGEIGDKTLMYEDWVYEDYIRTVQLYNAITTNDGLLTQPIVSINSQGSLTLEFDDITEDSDSYYVKLIHCNRDWTESQYRPIEYLSSYNEFNITEFDFSISTKVPYVHYTFTLPSVKVSGNYLLVVYRGGDEEDLILTKRFIIYEEAASVSAEVIDMIGSGEALSKQRVNFTVNYGGLTLDRPSESVLATVRKNYRWGTAIRDLKPLFVKQNSGELDFNYFNEENAFMGGNEFRFFDTGYEKAGLNVMDVKRMDDMNTIYLNHDKSREDRVFNSQKVQTDINGRYVIGAQAGNADEPEIEADYNEVNFVLESGNPYDGDVYVIGSFNDWKLKPENKLFYEAASGAYKGSLLLKQGRYDYLYSVYKNQKLNDSIIENSYNRTENEYDVIVYYKAITGKGDRVIAYTTVTVSK